MYNHIPLPAVQPLVLYLGLANEIAAGDCGKLLFLFAGQTCPLQHHRRKLETFYIPLGIVRMECEDRISDIPASDALRVETTRPHQFRSVGPVLIFEFSKPCVTADNYFANPAIPVGGNQRPC